MRMVRLKRKIPRAGVTLTVPATIDDFIDVVMKDHRKYIRW